MKSLDTPQEETQTQQTAESSCTGGFSQFGNWSHGCYMLGSHGRYNQALSSCTSAGGEMAGSFQIMLIMLVFFHTS